VYKLHADKAKCDNYVVYKLHADKAKCDNYELPSRVNNTRTFYECWQQDQMHSLCTGSRGSHKTKHTFSVHR